MVDLSVGLGSLTSSGAKSKLSSDSTSDTDKPDVAEQEVFDLGIWITTGHSKVAQLFENAYDDDEELFANEEDQGAFQFTWLKIGPEMLCGNYHDGGNIGIASQAFNLPLTPARILTRLFGDDLTVSSQGTRFETMGINSAGQGQLYARAIENAAHASDAFMNHYGSGIMANLTTCYIGQAVMAYLPSVITGDSAEHDVYGYFDSNSGFGYTYEWDVFADAADDLTAASLWNAGGGASTTFGSTTSDDYLLEVAEYAVKEGSFGMTPAVGQFGAEFGQNRHALAPNDWTKMAGATTTYHKYPPKNQQVPRSWAPQSLGVTTFCLEATGIDYVDNADTHGIDATSGPGSGMANAQELLSNDEMYPVSLTDHHSPAIITTNIQQDGGYVIQWGAHPDDLGQNYVLYNKYRYCAKMSANDMLGKFSYSHKPSYHEAIRIYSETRFQPGAIDMALDNAYNEDSLFLDKTNMNDETWMPWYSRLGTWEWEEYFMEASIARECGRVEDLYETVEFPKKLLNKVQKRRGLPNSSLSAFGIVDLDADGYNEYTKMTLSSLIGAIGSPQVVSAEGRMYDSQPQTGTGAGGQAILGQGDTLSYTEVSVKMSGLKSSSGTKSGGSSSLSTKTSLSSTSKSKMDK